MTQRRFTDQQVDAALDALSEPERFREAEARVARLAPQLQRILAQALQQGGWFEEVHEQEVQKAVAASDLARVRTLLAEEAHMGMVVGVAVGWELARELEMAEKGD